MGWLFIVLLALVVLAFLWRFGRLDRSGIQFAAAALLLALAGYAWQGHPDLAGQPRRAAAHREVAPSDFSKMRRDLLGQFDTADRWLTLAESYGRAGDTQGAAEIIQAALREHPRDADLWVGLGTTLVQHGGGLMTPAAQLAFDRAAAIAPDHPAPKFFYGLALLQGGKLDAAEQVWREQLAAAPPTALWRGAIERQLQIVAQARAQGMR
jgi:cytochrome c-type biogenesis protein CcmH/NrfG